MEEAASTVTFQDIINSPHGTMFVNHIKNTYENIIGCWHEAKGMESQLSMALIIVCSIVFGGFIIFIIILKETLMNIISKEKETTFETHRIDDSDVNTNFIENISSSTSTIYDKNIEVSKNLNNNMKEDDSLSHGKILDVDVIEFENSKESNGGTFTAYVLFCFCYYVCVFSLYIYINFVFVIFNFLFSF